METSNLKSILMLSAILALGAGEGRASLHMPAGPTLPEAPAPVLGEDRENTAGPQAEKPGRPPEGPAKEEKTDCDDCVIVQEGSPGEASERTAGGAGGLGLLASTLWGLFAVKRPKRIPRAFIRGITVP